MARLVIHMRLPVSIIKDVVAIVMTAARQQRIGRQLWGLGATRHRGMRHLYPDFIPTVGLLHKPTQGFSTTLHDELLHALPIQIIHQLGDDRL